MLINSGRGCRNDLHGTSQLCCSCGAAFTCVQVGEIVSGMLSDIGCEVLPIHVEAAVSHLCQAMSSWLLCGLLGV